MREYARTMAGYNRIANERLLEKCGSLGDGDYRRVHRVSFGSIHGLLNHVMLGDRIWMARFEGGGRVTPALDTVLFEDFGGLQAARTAEDERIEAFFAGVDEGFFEGSFSYTNNKGLEYVEAASVAVCHFFNHQTHHRGQIHALLTQSGVAGPSMDLHRIVNP
jgi:uncharacterized damage-inducible protein DinB